MILTPLQKLPINVGDLGKIFVASDFECFPKVQKIAQSGHTALKSRIVQDTKNTLISKFSILFIIYSIPYFAISKDYPEKNCQNRPKLAKYCSSASCQVSTVDGRDSNAFNDLCRLQTLTRMRDIRTGTSPSSGFSTSTRARTSWQLPWGSLWPRTTT